MPQSRHDGAVADAGRLRVEHALQSGAEIPPFYDSMIAKIISHGADARRGAAQADLRAGADRGVRRHHQPGVSDRLPAHPGFAAGDATTAFIGNHRDDCWRSSAHGTALKPRWRRCCSTSPIRMRRRGAADARWRRRSRCRRVSISARAVHEIEIVRERDGSYVAGLETARTAVRDRRARRRRDPLPRRRPDGVGQRSCATATGSISCIAASRLLSAT